jgi:uncharacterized protein YceK
MHRSLIVLAIAALAGGCASVPSPAAAPAGGGQTITVAAERVAQCRAQGGCLLVSQAELMQGMAEAYQAGASETAGTCRRNQL